MITVEDPNFRSYIHTIVAEKEVFDCSRGPSSLAVDCIKDVVIFTETAGYISSGISDNKSFAATCIKDLATMTVHGCKIEGISVIRP